MRQLMNVNCTSKLREFFFSIFVDRMLLYYYYCFSKQIRETLKEQMEQKQRTNQREFVDNCKESQIILQKDRADSDCDKQRQTERSVYLNQ